MAAEDEQAAEVPLLVIRCIPKHRIIKAESFDDVGLICWCVEAPWASFANFSICHTLT